MEPHVLQPEQDPDQRGARPNHAQLLVERLSYSAPAASTTDRSVWPWRWPRYGGPGRFENEARGGNAAGRLILDEVSFAVGRGRVYTVLGPSGSGKSTLLRALNRLVEPTSGRVLLDGTPTTDLPVQDLRRRIGMVFQTPALFPGTVADNVLYGPRLAGLASPLHAASLKPSMADDETRAVAGSLLRRVGLPDSFCEQPADELSGGEAQRVALARALANDPEVLLLDEPTAALDPSSSQVVEGLLLRLAGATDLTFVFVTHDLAQARRIGDHGLLLVDGRVVDAGPLPEFLDDPANAVVRRFVRGALHEGAS